MSSNRVLIESSADVLKSVFTSAKAMKCSEASLRLNESFLELFSIDPANVALIRLRVPRAAFTRVEGEGLFDVKVDEFADAFKRAKASETVTLSENLSTGGFGLSFKSGNRVREESLRCYDFDKRQPSFPVFETTALVSSPREVLEDALSTNEETVSVHVESGEVVFESSTYGEVKSRTILSPSDTFTFEGAARVKFSSDYFDRVLAAAKSFGIDAPTRLRFANDWPLLARLDLDGFIFEAVLAPKVDL